MALSGLPIVLTDDSGAFRLANASVGGHSLSVVAPGYRSIQEAIRVTRDTTLAIVLEPAPFRLDTLAVNGRSIKIHGRVKDATDGRDLVDVLVVAGSRHARTDPAGYFKVSHIPADVPVPVSVTDFGYLPLDFTVYAHRDTTLHLVLPPDSLVGRIVAVQVARLKRRAKAFDYPMLPAIDRAELLEQGGGSVLDMLHWKYGRLLDRIGCVLIDEQKAPNSWDLLAWLVPAELQRVEVLVVPGFDQPLQLRVYTRHFMATMIGGGIRLRMPVMFGGVCR